MRDRLMSTRHPLHPALEDHMAETTGIRIDDQMLSRIDAYVEDLKKKYPGLRLTRSDAIRDLVEKGLATVESVGGQAAVG
jgi:metal-responsive CopG/Arc/MetJ family transcriptional regulator